MKHILTLSLTLTIAAGLAGCARFHTKQVDTFDTSPIYAKTNTVANENAGLQTRTTEVSCWTLFSARSALTSFAARQADASQSATVGSLNQQGGTNVAGTLQALANLLQALPK